MADAFTAGVKPGGLNTSTEIRILLCYLIKSAGPLTRDAMQGAVLEEQLVNYFEFVDALNELEEQGLASIPLEEGLAFGLGKRCVVGDAHDELVLLAVERAQEARCAQSASAGINCHGDCPGPG